MYRPGGDQGHQAGGAAPLTLPLYCYTYCIHTYCAGDMWTAEEDETICDAVERLGQKWAPIAALLPGRSPNAVRNRFLRVLRPNQLAA
eukprot:scaffold77139_cov61-Phaeocystis_antarctica.AAC.6